MNNVYWEGCRARKRDEPYVSPYSHKSPAHYQWCAGWNDTDMIKYYVDPTTRLVRTCDGTDIFKPTGTWREVTLAEWNDFRKETKRMKRK